MKKILTVLFILLSTNLFAQRNIDREAVNALKNEKDSVALQEKLKHLEAGTEQDLTTLMNYYLGNNTKKDSIAKIIIKRFPKGDFAFDQAEHRMFAEDNPEEREKLLIKLKQEYPDRDMDQGNYVVSDAYAKNKNLPKMLEYLNLMKDPSKKTWALGYNAQRIDKYDSPAAEVLLKPEIMRFVSEGVPVEVGPKRRYYAFFYLYSDILIKQGKYKQALDYIKEAYANINPKSEQLSGDYGLAMSKNGLHAEALPVLEKLVNDGKASVEAKKAFSESYEKLNPGKTATEYLHNVDLALQAKLEAGVAKKLINEPAPEFFITDVNGKKKSLADFKGKTIILDFWATWCAPCKASFPSMQRAVDRFRNDPNVKFLFIHTLESAPDPLGDAKKYLKENNYRFDLYMDIKNAETKKNEAVRAFAVKGIPAKFIIDGKGNIRFKVVGFSESDDEAVKEISAMIKMAQQNG